MHVAKSNKNLCLWQVLRGLLILCGLLSKKHYAACENDGEQNKELAHVGLVSPLLRTSFQTSAADPGANFPAWRARMVHGFPNVNTKQSTCCPVRRGRAEQRRFPELAINATGAEGEFMRRSCSFQFAPALCLRSALQLRRYSGTNPGSCCCDAYRGNPPVPPEFQDDATNFRQRSRRRRPQDQYSGNRLWCCFEAR